MTTTTNVTFVNAGFWRSVGKHKTESKNVQSIVVPLPESELCSKEFRAAVLRHAPPGQGWMLHGYCVPRR